MTSKTVIHDTVIMNKINLNIAVQMQDNMHNKAHFIILTRAHGKIPAKIL
jgi:hypothetical protein